MRRPLLLAALASLVVGAGCGATDSSTPVACLEGPATYLKALEGAPGEVELGGSTSISECLAQNQKGGDLATVGESMLRATTQLNAEARAKPGGAANLQLGYLLGAAQRGADSTEGIHDELVRRLTAAARYSPGNRPPPAAFLSAYQRGFDAGEAHG
ncbi:MAG TPA: hypothetical protein VFI17_05475 [Solirubrobacterales bacterium]|nr:hypothetical protein [Solirubrobacterales bacterium]